MKKYVMAGASIRAYNMFAGPLARDFTDQVSIEGIFDINPTRSEILSKDNGDIPVYDDFDKMLKTVKPDAVIITTVDCFHHEYIIKSLEAGCDAITEKPMTIDAQKVRAILEAEKRTGRKVYVTFNYRYAPYTTKIKQLLTDGVIGEIYSVHFEWMLDRLMQYSAHGTSYFRRWNRYMQKSGGLLVHKATHHFDLVNWWINGRPRRVNAYGKLNEYGKNGRFRGERCLTCNYRDECEFYLDITSDEFAKRYYVEAEKHDGYYKDSCVFAEDIDIYDTMSVNVKYQNDVMLAYSLNAHCPYEGWRISINGSRGRLEAFKPETALLSQQNSYRIWTYDLNGQITTHDIPRAKGGHGGGDERLLKMLFGGGLPDPLGHKASSIDGALSVLTGAAANVSITQGRQVDIDELIGDSSLLKR